MSVGGVFSGSPSSALSDNRSPTSTGMPPSSVLTYVLTVPFPRFWDGLVNVPVSTDPVALGGAPATGVLGPPQAARSARLARAVTATRILRTGLRDVMVLVPSGMP